MSTLHILSHSPLSNNHFSSCLKIISDTDGLLLTGDSVYALNQHIEEDSNILNGLPDSISIYALKEDVISRKLNSSLGRVELIDYLKFVTLCCQYDRSNTWL